MRRFLVCSGVHSKPKSLDWLRQAVEQRRPDGIFFAGGVLDSVRQYAATTTPWGLTRDDARFLEKFFEVIGKLGIFTAVIPGPADTPLEDFLRIGMHAEIEYRTVHLVHATLIEQHDLAISGMGGCLADGPVTDPEICSRTLVEYHLRPLWTARQPHKVLLLAMPPKGLLGGPAGNTLISDLIDSYHPSLCVAAGPSDCRGTQRIGHTLVVNPGHLSDGWAAWLDWGRGGDEPVEFLDLRHPAASEVPVDIGAGD